MVARLRASLYQVACRVGLFRVRVGWFPTPKLLSFIYHRRGEEPAVPSKQTTGREGGMGKMRGDEDDAKAEAGGIGIAVNTIRCHIDRRWLFCHSDS